MLRYQDWFYNNNNKNNKKQNVLLLGDGFFARGFLHHINRNKFNITQIYKDEFINPQDLMYSLQRNIIFEKGFHIKDYFYKPVDIKIKEDIKSTEFIENKNILINNKMYNYDYLVIGLGSHKTLANWKDDINNFVNKKNISIAVVGMGPTGYEFASIVAKNNIVNMFDMLSIDKVLNYVSPLNKEKLLQLLDEKNIKTVYEKAFNPKDYKHDNFLMCVGNRPNNLTRLLKVDQFLTHNKNIYVGGDCINSVEYPKTAQVAYQQGAYVAKRLNGDIDTSEPFVYKHSGTSVNIGNFKVLIENHNFLPDGTYPDFFVKFYSMMFV
jgi:NADH dehydrogenase FAD-containing subunit